MKKILCASLFLLLLTCLAPAHAPSENLVEYDAENDLLKITARHAVGNARTHFVKRIVVLHGEREIFSRDFSTQKQAAFQEVVFSLDAEAKALRGAILTIISYCNVRGKLETEISLD